MQLCGPGATNQSHFFDVRWTGLKAPKVHYFYPTSMRGLDDITNERGTNYHILDFGIKRTNFTTGKFPCRLFVHQVLDNSGLEVFACS